MRQSPIACIIFVCIACGASARIFAQEVDQDNENLSLALYAFSFSSMINAEKQGEVGGLIDISMPPKAKPGPPDKGQKFIWTVFGASGRSLDGVATEIEQFSFAVTVFPDGRYKVDGAFAAMEHAALTQILTGVVLSPVLPEDAEVNKEVKIEPTIQLYFVNQLVILEKNEDDVTCKRSGERTMGATLEENELISSFATGESYVENASASRTARDGNGTVSTLSVEVKRITNQTDAQE